MVSPPGLMFVYLCLIIDTATINVLQYCSNNLILFLNTFKFQSPCYQYSAYAVLESFLVVIKMYGYIAAAIVSSLKTYESGLCDNAYAVLESFLVVIKMYGHIAAIVSSLKTCEHGLCTSNSVTGNSSCSLAATQAAGKRQMQNCAGGACCGLSALWMHWR
jgi:hypothetical protein